MHPIRLCLQKKGNAVWSVSPEATVFEALRLMKEKNIGALLVMKDQALVGVFSERDYARKVVLHGKSSRDTPVSEIMTPVVVTIGIDQSIEECMAIMTEKRFRHLPVIEDGRVVGVISIGDVVKEIIADKEFVITQLENYITGKR